MALQFRNRDRNPQQHVYCFERMQKLTPARSPNIVVVVSADNLNAHFGHNSMLLLLLLRIVL